MSSVYTNNAFIYLFGDSKLFCKLAFYVLRSRQYETLFFFIFTIGILQQHKIASEKYNSIYKQHLYIRVKNKALQCLNMFTNVTNKSR